MVKSKLLYLKNYEDSKLLIIRQIAKFSCRKFGIVRDSF